EGANLETVVERAERRTCSRWGVRASALAGRVRHDLAHAPTVEVSLPAQDAGQGDGDDHGRPQRSASQRLCPGTFSSMLEPAHVALACTLTLRSVKPGSLAPSQSTARGCEDSLK